MPPRFLILLFVIVFACNSKNAADIIYQNATIYTANPTQPEAQAIAIKDGKILFVGNTNGLKSYIGTNTEIINANGLFIRPGFIDSLANEPIIVGSIEIGKQADLTIIDQDIRKLPADKIRNARILKTIVGGKTMYDATKK